jgi:glycosyltransferase involved in cell wall biosynthesis
VRVGIDYTAAVRQVGGIGRYTRNLVRALAELGSENSYKLFVAGGWGAGDGLEAWPSNYRVHSVPFSERLMHIFWQRLRLPVPMQAVTGPLDLFHSPDFVLPPLGRTPAIVTVHDLSFLRVPDCYVPSFRQYLEEAVTRAVRRADRILADSESTRRDLVELLGAEPDDVTVLYPGVESRFQPVRHTRALEKVRRRYVLPERFILSLSTLQPRKNFTGLVKGFRSLVSDGGFARRWADLHLVIVGEEGWMFEDIYAEVAKSGLEDRVLFTGFVRDHDLPALYSLAEAFAFPTWYEGFGLPVLEAMACGTPVVAAKNSSLPEIVGDAGVLVDAGDPEALGRALEQLLLDGVLRARLVGAGLEQAKRFTWQAAAKKLLTEYDRFG